MHTLGDIEAMRRAQDRYDRAQKRRELHKQSARMARGGR